MAPLHSLGPSSTPTDACWTPSSTVQPMSLVIGVIGVSTSASDLLPLDSIRKKAQVAYIPQVVVIYIAMAK
ncbi:hypothetical protein PAXINDRAFT_18266 [Paxillus involutus ATCC 200175]|uniref:Uncharacterized protein n=1 Tax=Paxillus involutus ATCC 200175 TaxID=664439 RepID=A0A0C9TLJ4_PAXIN|nr:hypothetical protein PAXINDRAFT_18266 [Paxillus involutus ATCC 200175]